MWGGPEGDINQGDDIAGVVHEVGNGVVEFKKGDRVAAFHQMFTPGGSYAEYSVAWKHTTFFLPEKTSFQGQYLGMMQYTTNVHQRVLRYHWQL